MRAIPESDWKVFRELRVVALDRFCERILNEVVEVAADAGKSNHDRFLALFKLLDQRNDELANAFDDPRRSTALIQLLSIHSSKLLTEDEFARFTPETRAV